MKSVFLATQQLDVELKNADGKQNTSQLRLFDQVMPSPLTEMYKFDKSSS